MIEIARFNESYKKNQTKLLEDVETSISPLFLMLRF